MGYGPVANGKQKPVTPWKGSWAQQQQQARVAPPTTCDETGKYPEIVGYEWSSSVDASDARPSDSGTAVDSSADPVPVVRGVPGWLVQAVEATSARKRAA